VATLQLAREGLGIELQRGRASLWPVYLASIAVPTLAISLTSG